MHRADYNNNKKKIYLRLQCCQSLLMFYFYKGKLTINFNGTSLMPKNCKEVL